MRIPNGDLYLARDYLERVAASNSEDVARASELLKAVKATIQVKALAEADARARQNYGAGNVVATSTSGNVV